MAPIALHLLPIISVIPSDPSNISGAEASIGNLEGGVTFCVISCFYRKDLEGMGGTQQGSHLYYKPSNQVIDRVKPKTSTLCSPVLTARAIEVET